LALIYSEPYDHTRWDDHVVRVRTTIAFGTLLARSLDGCASITDLSCGDGAIAAGIADELAFDGTPPTVTLGDYVPGWSLCGPIEETIGKIDPCDLFILSETLEHLDDPDAMLAAIRPRARALLLSTPAGERDTGNPQHYWGWDVEDVAAMLRATGWAPTMTTGIGSPGDYYHFQVWGAV
jgi:hypothetical protein